MDWYPSVQMTVDDLKAVLLSWRIKIPAKPNMASNETEKENLRRLVAINHQKIMHDIFGGGGAPASSSGDVAPSIGAAIDKAVGTDSPLAEFSFIGSDHAGDDDANSVTNIGTDIINDRVLAAAAGARNDEQDLEQSAASAAHYPEPVVIQILETAETDKHTAASAKVAKAKASKAKAASSKK